MHGGRAAQSYTHGRVAVTSGKMGKDVITSQWEIPRSERDPSAAPDGAVDDDGDGELVVVRSAVLATVDHAFGNLFQRLYHLIRTLRTGEGQHSVPVLESSIRELHGLLELFVDYVAPMSLEVRPVPIADVTRSFCRHADDQLGAGRLQVSVDADGEATVVIDPARLARAFHLLAPSLAESAGRPCAECGIARSATHFEIRVDGSNPSKSAAADLRWALAEKLVDLQGGELRRLENGRNAGWILRLPLMLK